MFNKTRTRLTLIYSVILTLIMLTLILLIYFGLVNILSNNVKNQLNTSANSVSKTITAISIKYEKIEGILPKGKIARLVDYLQTNIPLNQFALSMNNQGTIIISSLKDPELIAGMQKMIHESQGEIENTDVYYFDINDRSFAIKSILSSQDRKLYIGLERTDNVNLLKNIRTRMALLAIFLLAIASVLGHIFAGRAMHPIITAYQRQQEFTADASHELRTPLSILLSSAEILDEIRDQIPPIYQTVLINMMDEIKHTIRLLENLLTLTRRDSGNYELAMEEFDIIQLTLELIEHMQTIAQKKEIRLSVQTPETHNLVYYGDKDRIRQYPHPALQLKNKMRWCENFSTNAF